MLPAPANQSRSAGHNAHRSQGVPCSRSQKAGSTRSQRARQMLAAQRLPRSCQGHVPGHNLPERSARARCAGAAAAGISLGISPACWRSRQKKQEEEEQSGLGWHAIRLTIERPKAPLTRATNSRKASQAGRRWPRQYNWSDALILAINRLGRSGPGANWRGRRPRTRRITPMWHMPGGLSNQPTVLFY